MDIDTALLELITTIKDLSPQFWAIIMRQVQIEMYQNIFWGIVCAVLLAVGLPISFKWYKKYNAACYDNGGYLFAAVIAWILAGMSVITLPFIISDLFTIVMNPEFKAIKFLLSQVQ